MYEEASFLYCSLQRKRMATRKRLLRSDDRVVAGVCAGIADYFEIDPTVIRVLWVVLSVFTAFFPGVLAYIILWIVIPQGRA